MVGWEHDGKPKTSLSGCMFNMILRDGTSSNNSMAEPDGKEYNRYYYYLPQNTRITAVTIYYDEFISGFRFHLGDGSEWDIGYFAFGLDENNNFEIADNEVIVGF